MIEFDEPLHRGGAEMVGHIGIALVQATAWWIAAELIRRHPDQLTVIETHPAGGTYDCISVHRTDDHDNAVIVYMNLGGSITPGKWFSDGTQERFQWPEVILTPRRRQYVVEQIEREQGLLPPTSSPATTRRSIGPRLVAGFFSRTALGRGGHPPLTYRDEGMPWTALNGFQDSAGYGGGRRDDLFKAFPGLTKRRQSQDAGPLGDSGYRYWFVLDRHETPRVAIDITSGTAWSSDSEHDLMHEYSEAGHRLDPIINALFPSVQ